MKTLVLLVLVLLSGCAGYRTWSYSYEYPIKGQNQGARIHYQTAEQAGAPFARYSIPLFLRTDVQQWVLYDYLEGGTLIRTIGGPPEREYTIQIGVVRRVAPRLPDIGELVVEVDSRRFRLVDPSPVYDKSGPEREKGTAEFVVSADLLDALSQAQEIAYQTATYRHVETPFDVVSLSQRVRILRTLPDEVPLNWRADL